MKNQVKREASQVVEQEKVYKIKYQCNLMTSMSQERGSLMDAIADSEELEIFKTDLIKDMLDYKW